MLAVILVRYILHLDFYSFFHIMKKGVKTIVKKDPQNYTYFLILFRLFQISNHGCDISVIYHENF